MLISHGDGSVGPISLAGAHHHSADRGRRMVCVEVASAGINGISGRDRTFSDVLYRHRDQSSADDRAVPLYAMAGSLIPEHASLPADRHAVIAAHHPDVHGLVVLGIPRQGAQGRGISLVVTARSKASIGCPSRSASP